MSCRHGYYAAVSYVDSNIGKVLASLESLGLAENTVVGLIADHGYQLGEHEMYVKQCKLCYKRNHALSAKYCIY